MIWLAYLAQCFYLGIGVELVLLCPSCGSALPPNSHMPTTTPKPTMLRLSCPTCHWGRPVSLCVICHRPVEGLARDCVRCFHGGASPSLSKKLKFFFFDLFCLLGHLDCISWWWTDGDGGCCPTGCGCR
jgi:hypothetical protein